MYSRIVTFLSATAYFALGGCTTPSPPDITPISSARVVNSVKCGLALALYKEQVSSQPKRLTGNVASLELQLKVTTAETVGGSVAGVIPFQGGPSILPAFSASRATAWTVDSTLNASYKLDATNTDMCKAAGIVDMSAPESDPLGFSRWLGLTLDDLGKVSLEKPSGVLNSLTYEAAFGVTNQAGGGVTLQLAFLTANVNAASSRGDLQRLKVVISGAPVAPKAPSSTAKPETGNLGPFFDPRALQNFSTIAPAQESE